MTIAPFKRPRQPDQDALDKMLVKSYMDERNRRRRFVDDDFRNDIDISRLPQGTFALSRISMHDPIEQMAFDKLGGRRIPLEKNYRCTHCGMEFGMQIPPLECPRCHRLTYLGELEKQRAFNK